MDILKPNSVEEKIISVRGISVILDSDVAKIYEVETRDINKAVKNNPDKFPEGYIFELVKNEKEQVVENFHHLENLKFSPVVPKAFTEKGLYMLATILKTKRATQATIEIVEAFTKLRELSQTLIDITQTTDEKSNKSLLTKSGNLLNDLLFNDLQKVSSDYTVEFNLGLMKIKQHTKRELKSKEEQNELKEVKELLQAILNIMKEN
jgi:phage regulator Rha-like protein